METNPLSPTPLPPEKPELSNEDVLSQTDSYIEQDRYQGSIWIRGSLLLDDCERLSSVLMPIHHAVYREMKRKLNNRGKLSRSHHKQLSQVFTRYRDAQEGATPAHLLLLEDLGTALEQAELLERACELRMEAFRQKDRGNVKMVEKIDWKVKTQTRNTW